jgi:hypothetical protein
MLDQLVEKGLKYVFVHSHPIVKTLGMASQKFIQPLLTSELGCIFGRFVVTGGKVVLDKGSSGNDNDNSCLFFFALERSARLHEGGLSRESTGQNNLKILTTLTTSVDASYSTTYSSRQPASRRNPKWRTFQTVNEKNCA